MSRSPKILIVEDDSFKVERIVTCIRRFDSSVQHQISNSVQDAVSILAGQSFDFVLLDMALPSHDLEPGGGSPSSLLSGGLEVVMELALLERSDRVVIITQYPEIEIDGDLIPLDRVREALLSKCGFDVDGVLYYRDEASDWELDLIDVLGQ